MECFHSETGKIGLSNGAFPFEKKSIATAPFKNKRGPGIAKEEEEEKSLKKIADLTKLTQIL